MTRRPTSEPETLSKIDAAERQIRGAIRLFFEDEDLVPVVTLARAGAEVLRDIGKPLGKRDQLLDSDLIVEGKEAEWREIVRREQNFLKHADRDPGATLEFRAATVPLTVYFATVLLWEVGERDVPETRVFLGWLLDTYPEMIKPEFANEPRVAPRAFWKGANALDAIRSFRVLEKIGEWPPDSERAIDGKSYGEHLYDKGVRVGERGLTVYKPRRLIIPDQSKGTIE